ncbi:hypothetical protein [Methylosinus sp. PW1]|uniref:hypothetical protein n=1 Tax=Methylosinus sp. PW1 TaxID=107636 RepID=UPI0012EBE966|nr:hypothetical protein [Methylosinus sp. PW1]
MTPLGITLHYERATGYDLHGVEDLSHADDETNDIDLEDDAEDAVCIDACDAHLQDLRADSIVTRLEAAAADGTEVVLETSFARDFIAHLAERDAAAAALLEKIGRLEREAASLRDRLARALDGDAYRWIEAIEMDEEARADDAEARRLADIEAALREEADAKIEEVKTATETSLRAEFSRTMATKLSEAKAAMTRLLSGFGESDEAA